MNDKRSPLRNRLFKIIFDADTPAGKWFDIILLLMIIASVIAVMIETIPNQEPDVYRFLYRLEWVFTIFFSLEYILRLYTSYRPLKYATSFFGIIDLISILPVFIGLFISGTHSLLIIRALRLLRVFRIFKMMSFLKERDVLMQALRSSRQKVFVFLLFVLIFTCIFGSIMYLVEGDTNERFDSIPRGVYWAIVTLTTVGYGDIAPQTNIGQFLSAIVMILGYAVIAVPTGIVSAELVNTKKPEENNSSLSCKSCMNEGHDFDAVHCKFCGANLHDDE